MAKGGTKARWAGRALKPDESTTILYAVPVLLMVGGAEKVSRGPTE